MDFKSFLVKYTTINRKFIEDFHNIVKEYYFEKYYDFLIDSEILRKWLQIENKRIFMIQLKIAIKLMLIINLKKIRNQKDLVDIIKKLLH